ncbi:MAG: DedA family protein [Thermoanaerobaculia bacterium]
MTLALHLIALVQTSAAAAEHLLQEFGYVAVFVGTFFEGETILVTAGFFAERGYLTLAGVIMVGASGAFMGHLFWFWIGRTRGTRILDRFPRLGKPLGRGLELFERFGVGAIFITQYLYGLRVASAIVFGLTRISAAKFILYQAISCATWAALIGSLGYFFGQAIEAVLGKAAHIEKWGLAAIVVVSFLAWLYHRIKSRREERMEIDEEAPTPPETIATDENEKDV